MSIQGDVLVGDALARDLHLRDGVDDRVAPGLPVRRDGAVEQLLELQRRAVLRHRAVEGQHGQRRPRDVDALDDVPVVADGLLADGVPERVTHRAAPRGVVDEVHELLAQVGLGVPGGRVTGDRLADARDHGVDLGALQHVVAHEGPPREQERLNVWLALARALVPEADGRDALHHAAHPPLLGVHVHHEAVALGREDVREVELEGMRMVKKLPNSRWQSSTSCVGIRDDRLEAVVDAEPRVALRSGDRERRRRQAAEGARLREGRDGASEAGLPSKGGATELFNTSHSPRTMEPTEGSVCSITRSVGQGWAPCVCAPSRSRIHKRRRWRGASGSDV